MKKYIWMFFGAALVVVIILVIVMREEGEFKSPKEVHTLNDGDLNIEVAYSRPSKRGRDVFGALVPYDKIWRTGANEATEFRTNKSLSFNGQTLPAGNYSVWTQPGANTWKVLINSTIPEWGINENGAADHNPNTDVISVEVASELVPETIEMFTMKVEKSDSVYNLIMSWDKTKVSVPFTQK
jgi:hypothetical protein